MIFRSVGVAAVCGAILTMPAAAATFTVTVGGGDAIFLAGRSDLTIPPANQPWGDNDASTDDGMRRHAAPTPEEVLETVPPFIPVQEADVVRVLDPAVGGVNFFNGSGPPFFGPEGNATLSSSSIASFGGISGYKGTQGALTGVFLTDAVPTGSPPTTLDFGTIGADFASLSPEIGQIFFIGDGQTSGGTFHDFVAPAGATRLFLGIPDAFGFDGVPGAYDDNDGAYRIRVGVNETPTNDIPPIPLPAAGWLLLGGLGALAALRRRG